MGGRQLEGVKKTTKKQFLEFKPDKLAIHASNMFPLYMSEAQKRTLSAMCFLYCT